MTNPVRPIESFDKEYRFLSNFHPTPIRYKNRTWPTVEHCYQAMKTEDLEDQHKIRKAKTAGEAKRMGKSVTLREDWEDVKLLVMRALLKRKFEDPEMRMKLLATGERLLIEGNWWGDTYWGVCKGIGENWLGRMLMNLRSEIQQEVLEGISDEQCREVAPKAKRHGSPELQRVQGPKVERANSGGAGGSSARSYRSYREG